MPTLRRKSGRSAFLHELRGIVGLGLPFLSDEAISRDSIYGDDR